MTGPKFALIVPLMQLDYLPRSAKHLGYHMALGQALVQSRAYRKYYRRLGRRDRFIIVDNGAAEPEAERVPFSNVRDAAEEIGADEIILPDVIRDCSATLTEISKHEKIIREIPPYRRFVVPQGETIEEWSFCLTEISRMIDFATIGIPKHLERLDDGRRSAVAAVRSMHQFDSCPLHYLGIWENPLQEIRRMCRQRWPIRGIDSGAPIAYAQKNQPMDISSHVSLEWNAPHVPVEAVDHNLKQIRGWIATERIQYLTFKRDRE